jgi:hypothetical protein
MQRLDNVIDHWTTASEFLLYCATDPIGEVLHARLIHVCLRKPRAPQDGGRRDSQFLESAKQSA